MWVPPIRMMHFWPMPLWTMYVWPSILWWYIGSARFERFPYAPHSTHTQYIRSRAKGYLGEPHITHTHSLTMHARSDNPRSKIPTHASYCRSLLPFASVRRASLMFTKEAWSKRYIYVCVWCVCVPAVTTQPEGLEGENERRKQTNRHTYIHSQYAFWTPQHIPIIYFTRLYIYVYLQDVCCAHERGA